MEVVRLLTRGLGLLGVRLPSHVAPRHCAFDLTVTWETNAPDGIAREMILVNGQFPGPTLDIREGQDVVVRVHNKMPFNTSVHFHGIEMHNTPWSDGVSGVSQRPIQPDETFTYRWKATQYGAYWYHAHSHGQIEDGLYGPIIIRPAKSQPRPFSLITNDSATLKALEHAENSVRPLVLSDWRHTTSTQWWDTTLAAGFEMSCYDSILINGKGGVKCRSEEEIKSLLSPDQQLFLTMFNTSMTDKACLPATVLDAIGGGGGNLSAVPHGIFEGCTPSAGLTEVIKIPVTGSGDKWISFDIIGAFGFVTSMVSVDEHPMWVYAVDGQYVTPQLVDAIPITNGDRFSVFVKLSKAGDYSIRVASIAAPQIVSGTAVLSYRPKKNHGKGHGKDKMRRTEPEKQPVPVPSSSPYIDDAGRNVTADVRFWFQPAAKPYPPIPITPVADATFKLDMRIDGQSYRWALNNSLLLPADFEARTPVLFDPKPYQLDNVTISTRNGTWVDLILVAAIVPMPPHPIHKHGNKMFMIGAGEGTFNWTSVDEAMKEIPQNFNLVDPPLRDSFATPPAITGPAWMALRYQVTNPGAWLIHCHIQNHMMGGMSMFIQDGVDAWPTVPPEYLLF